MSSYYDWIRTDEAKKALKNDADFLDNVIGAIMEHDNPASSNNGLIGRAVSCDAYSVYESWLDGQEEAVCSMCHDNGMYCPACEGRKMEAKAEYQQCKAEAGDKQIRDDEMTGDA